MIKRMLLLSLSLVFLILLLWLIFGREEDAVNCSRTAEVDFAAFAALRSKAFVAKKSETTPCAEAGFLRKQIYE